MARWVDILIPWDQQGPAVQALIDSFGELPGITMDMSRARATQTISLMDVAPAERIAAALKARDITVLSARTRLAEELRIDSGGAS